MVEQLQVSSVSTKSRLRLGSDDFIVEASHSPDSHTFSFAAVGRDSCQIRFTANAITITTKDPKGRIAGVEITSEQVDYEPELELALPSSTALGKLIEVFENDEDLARTIVGVLPKRPYIGYERLLPMKRSLCDVMCTACQKNGLAWWCCASCTLCGLVP